MTATAEDLERVVCTFVAVARCATCHWAASMTGDTELEVTSFLRALLMAHVSRVHRRGREERPS